MIFAVQLNHRRTMVILFTCLYFTIPPPYRQRTFMCLRTSPAHFLFCKLIHILTTDRPYKNTGQILERSNACPFTFMIHLFRVRFLPDSSPAVFPHAGFQLSSNPSFPFSTVYPTVLRIQSQHSPTHPCTSGRIISGLPLHVCSFASASPCAPFG